MGCGMASSSFLCAVGTGKIAKQGIARKGILLDRAARQGIAVPVSMVLLDDAWRYARSHDLFAGRTDALTPRDANEFIQSLGIFHALSPLGARVAVRALFFSTQQIESPSDGVIKSKLRIDRRDPQGLATAICAVWSTAHRDGSITRRDLLLTTMIDAQHAGIAVSEAAYADDLVNFTASAGEQLVRGQISGMTLTLPRIIKGESHTAALPFAQRLQHLLRQIRAVFGDQPWEVEWADDGTTCWLIQLQTLVHSPRRNERFGSGEIREAMPDLPSYFMAQLYRGTSNDLFAYFRRFDQRIPPHRQFVEIFAGRPRFNYGMIADVFRTWGLSGNMAADLNDAVLVAIPYDKFRVRQKWWLMVKLAWDSLRRPQHTVHQLRSLYTQAKRFNGEIDLIMMVLHEAIVLHYHADIALARIIGPLESWMRRRRVYAQWSSRYQSLNRTIVADLAPVRAYLATRPDITELLRQQMMPSDAVFAGMWEEMLARYGHRGTTESDIATPRYREQSQAVMQIVLQGTTMITANRHTLASLLAWPVWLVLRWALTKRDAIRNEVMRLYDRCRRVLLQQAAHAVKRGYLPRADMIWNLSPDEIVRIFAGWQMPDAMYAARIAQIQYQAQLQVPALVMRYDDSDRWRADNGNLRALLEGRSINDGIVEGVTWRLAHPSPFMPAGLDAQRTILVTRVFDAQWIEVAQQCAGVILEHGSELSHGASMLRTLGIPAISAVRGAYDALSTGTPVRLVAGSGYVEILTANVRLLLSANQTGLISTYDKGVS
jgi:phosphohistidine swiveling domain-containing protein